MADAPTAAAAAAAAAVYPLYNRTYLLYRLSPLHHGHTPLLDHQTLRTHAQRLRNQLKGDSIRGVEVDFAGTEAVLPNLGPLEGCSWDIVGDEDAWADRQRRLASPDASELSSSTLARDQARGLEVTLDYERQSYNALLLCDPATTTSPPEAFTSLPLLMLKMPAPIREIFLNYLKTAFDAHVAPLRLQPAFLTSSLEAYFHRLTAPNSTQSIRDVIRRLSVQLSFPTSPTLLKHIDVNIAEKDVPRFFSRGKLMQSGFNTPFMSALSSYLQRHLALDLSNPKVHISKITCGSFTISTDRIKLLAPTYTETSFVEYQETLDASPTQLAMRDLYASLVRQATGSGQFLSEHPLRERNSSTPSSVGSARHAAGRRKRAISTTAPSNANTKKAKARGKENGPGGGDVDMDDR